MYIAISSAVCLNDAVRLMVFDETYLLYYYDDNSAYFDKDGLRVGTVEVCVGGSYGTICVDSWDNRDASVVCQQLELSPFGKSNLRMKIVNFIYVFFSYFRSYCY